VNESDFFFLSDSKAESILANFATKACFSAANAANAVCTLAVLMAVLKVSRPSVRAVCDACEAAALALSLLLLRADNRGDTSLASFASLVSRAVPIPLFRASPLPSGRGLVRAEGLGLALAVPLASAEVAAAAADVDEVDMVSISRLKLSEHVTVTQPHTLAQRIIILI
jgi:hypothetical protein